jgi:hypothetical protein
MNPGKPTGAAIKILELAVYQAASVAQILLLPMGSPFAGSHAMMPFLTSGWRMNQLFANPPTPHAMIVTIALMTTRRAPVDLSV